MLCSYFKYSLVWLILIARILRRKEVQVQCSALLKSGDYNALHRYNKSLFIYKRLFTYKTLSIYKTLLTYKKPFIYKKLSTYNK